MAYRRSLEAKDGFTLRHQVGFAPPHARVIGTTPARPAARTVLRRVDGVSGRERVENVLAVVVEHDLLESPPGHRLAGTSLTGRFGAVATGMGRTERSRRVRDGRASSCGSALLIV
jgi:hypothetical protein